MAAWRDILAATNNSGDARARRASAYQKMNRSGRRHQQRQQHGSARQRKQRSGLLKRAINLRFLRVNGGRRSSCAVNNSG